MPADRSYEPITEADLRRLAGFAAGHRERWFRNERSTSVFQRRFLCSALCQGAAQHYVDGENGIKDFDIYEFYADAPDVTIPARARWCYDFGPSRFGRQVNSTLHPEYVGRRIDLMVRALPVAPTADPVAAVRDWLRTSRATTPTLLAQKAVVLLEPANLLGQAIWPVSDDPDDAAGRAAGGR